MLTRVLIAAPGVSVMTSGRLAAMVAVLIGLCGVFVGGVALTKGEARRAAIVALVAGVVGAMIGGVVVVASPTGVGTGNGVGGGFVSIAVGTIGAVLGALALARSRRTG
jgi:hypothetical protein